MTTAFCGAERPEAGVPGGVSVQIFNPEEKRKSHKRKQQVPKPREIENNLHVGGVGQASLGKVGTGALPFLI